ncbi:S1C family serine protease [Pseudohongiella sp.]|uniref:Serine protease n=1 Tax=marine sediment metagenome TaxID=412755 RepID=A0A0F9Y333_9ZZZZ|nr:serine protease [Pseudohongiella sp.]HDZ08933.1 serine protease [Pseudohongiella sp.]HEA63989.1 serine protease [Pseudohongiella sp.]
MRSSTFLLLMAITPAAVMAQDVSRDAYFGEISLSAGFADDPRVIDMVAGGSVNLSQANQFDCNGFVSDAPDYQIDYSTGSADFELSFFAESTVDTVLLINAPDGQWHCNDDYSEELGLTAGVTFERPLAGIYDIWVGVYNEGDVYAETELYITELASLLTDQGSETSGSSGTAANGSPQVIGSGTAFAVTNEGHLITNYHVISECSSLRFQLPGALAIEATVVATNESFDLALLKTDSTTRAAPFRTQGRIRLGDDIVVYGFPLLGDLSSSGNLTNGLVSALTGLGDDLSTFQISAQIQPGNSGGPVFDIYGAVVGVVVSTANQDYFAQQSGNIPQNVNFAITSDITQSFLRANNIRYELSDNSEELSTADIAERAQTMTGALLCYR